MEAVADAGHASSPSFISWPPSSSYGDTGVQVRLVSGPHPQHTDAKAGSVPPSQKSLFQIYQCCYGAPDLTSKTYLQIDMGPYSYRSRYLRPAAMAQRCTRHPSSPCQMGPLSLINGISHLVLLGVNQYTL